MRVNPDLRSALLASLNRVDANQQTLLNQISSGVRIQTPADDPAGAASLVEVQAEDAATEQYVASTNVLESQMQAADSALNSVGEALNRALSLGAQGGDGTLSDSNRSAIGNELGGIKDQLLQLGNSSFQGKYLFAGTAVSTTPYVSDATSPTGISYRGNDAANQVEIGQNYWIQSNVPGSSIFGDGSDGIFKAISDLITAVQNNSGVNAATTEIGTMIGQVSSARVQYGNAMNQLTSSQGMLNNDHVQLQQQINNLSATDIAKAASDLATVQNQRSALFNVIAKTNSDSLFNYLP
ncbi:MAG TPA: flagellar hook-associated protein FlgL [Terriglobales bacterium]|nr:flagellar hook-associated protein FlgL [Terriglobales bacterium]